MKKKSASSYFSKVSKARERLGREQREARGELTQQERADKQFSEDLLARLRNPEKK